MKYKIEKGDKVYASDSLENLMYLHIVSKEAVKEIFDEEYEVVDTPIGTIPMSFIMENILDDVEFLQFQKVYGQQIVEYLDADANEWNYEDNYCDAVEDFDGWKIYRYYLTDEEKESFDKLYANSTKRIEKTVNRMEGVW